MCERLDGNRRWWSMRMHVIPHPGVCRQRMRTSCPSVSSSPSCSARVQPSTCAMPMDENGMGGVHIGASHTEQKQKGGGGVGGHTP